MASLMNLKCFVFNAILLGVVTTGMGQTFSPRFVELKKEAPIEVQRSAVVGPKFDNDLLHVAVSLPLGDPVGARQYADAVSNPASPLYRQFLSPDEFGYRFGLRLTVSSESRAIWLPRV